MTGTSPRIIAHRGAKHARPENTLCAFDQGLVEGADGIEMDIRLTRDGVPVIFHDHTLRKLGYPRQRLSELTLAELRSFDFGGWFSPEYRGEPIPTLQQVLERYGSRTELCLELKTARDAATNAELVRQTVDLVQASGASERVQILCFDAHLLELAHARAPGLRYVLNALAAITALPAARRMPWLDAIDVDIRWLTPAAGIKMRAGDRGLMSYTCNTEAHLRAARAAGVHAVITNYPARARAQLNE
jgi:glycerophosphoryl diester phosphodiesterase